MTIIELRVDVKALWKWDASGVLTLMFPEAIVARSHHSVNLLLEEQ
jgi:hypothetical protein